MKINIQESNYIEKGQAILIMHLDDFEEYKKHQEFKNKVQPKE